MENQLNMDILRSGDKIIFENGEEVEIVNIVYRTDDGLYYVNVGNDTAFRYNESGKCEFPGYDIKETVLVEKESDKITYYVPYVYWMPSPVVTIRVKGGRKPIKQEVIKSIFELNGFGPFYKGEIITADIKPVVYAELRKCKGRNMEVLKVEKIFCKDEKEAEETIANFKDKYLDLAEEKSNNDTGSEVKKV